MATKIAPSTVLFDPHVHGVLCTWVSVLDHTVLVEQAFQRDFDGPRGMSEFTYKVEFSHESARDLIAFLQEHLPQLAEATR